MKAKLLFLVSATWGELGSRRAIQRSRREKPRPSLHWLDLPMDQRFSAAGSLVAMERRLDLAVTRRDSADDGLEHRCDAFWLAVVR
jgi:hypothetical protein